MAKDLKYTKKKLHAPKYVKNLVIKNIKMKKQKSKFSLMKLWYRIKNLPSTIYWWFNHRYNPNHQYNVVKTGLKPGYYDTDSRMEHACFYLLEEFLKEEFSPKKNVIESIDEELFWLKKELLGANPESIYPSKLYYTQRIEMWNDLKEVYLWWMQNKNKSSYNETYYSASFEEEKRFENDKTEMLIKLIKNRGILWT